MEQTKNMPYSLPVELILKSGWFTLPDFGAMLTDFYIVLLLCLEDDPACSTRLLLVNRATTEWLIPFVYHSISFTTAQKLVTFHRIHDVPDSRLSQRLNLIHNLYIGAAPEGWSSRGDLLYASDVWPITILCRIFCMCASLKNLALLYLDPTKRKRLEHAIPASVKKLVLGPIHGPFHPSDLAKRPQLEHFTNADSLMRDDEVMDIVTYPSLKTFRRISNALSLSGVASFTHEQLKCVGQSTTLEKYEIVVCNTESSMIPDLKLIQVIECSVKKITDDPRICVGTVPKCRWGTVIHDEYHDFRRQHFRNFL